MKRLYIFSILFILAIVSVNAQVSKVFEQYSETQGVTTVYISKTMLSMMPDIQAGKMELKGVTNKLNYIKVLTTQRAYLIREIYNSIKLQMKRDKFETLISTNDGNERANIYMKTDSRGVNEYLIVNQNKGELSAVLINGTITLADVQKMNLK
ncbi:MAG: DUF4252 domain-containing protein [Muribaculaceae bacterium]|nr:DUF4252 domain-containing protein [Muribaculaceae bacterium]